MLFFAPSASGTTRRPELFTHWAFNYDLATASAIADKGMDSFNEIIAFPDQGAEILSNLQNEVEKLSIR